MVTCESAKNVSRKKPSIVTFHLTMKLVNLMRFLHQKSLEECFCTRRYFLKNDRNFKKSTFHFSSSAILKNSSLSQICISPVSTNAKMSPQISEILAKFSDLTKEECFTNIIINPALEKCKTVLPELSPKEFFSVVDVLSELANKFPDLYYYDTNVMDLVADIDKKFCSLLRLRDEEVTLELIEYNHVLPIRSEFRIRLVMKMNQFLKWSTPTVIKLFKIVNAHKAWNAYYVDKYKIEIGLLHHLPALKIDDILPFLTALGYLSNSLLTPNLAQKLFDRFVEEYSQAKPETIVGFLKYFSNQGDIFRKSVNVDGSRAIPIFVKIMRDNSNSWPLESLIYSSDLLVSLFCYDLEFYKNYAHRLADSDEFYKLTPKMLEKAINPLVYWGYSSQNEDVYRKFLNRIKSEPMYSLMKTRPKKLINILETLSRIAVYDYDLLDIVLSNGFLIDTYGKLTYHCVKSRIFALDFNVSLDCSDYDGSRLLETLRNEIEKRWNSRLPILHRPDEPEEFEAKWQRSKMYTKFYYSLRELLIELFGGEEFIHICYFHPHISRENLLFGIRNKIPQALNELRNTVLVKKHMLNENCTWFTFSLHRRNSIPPHQPLLIHNGFNSSRCLKYMNINSIPLIIPDWDEMDGNAKKQYLRERIFGTDDNNVKCCN